MTAQSGRGRLLVGSSLILMRSPGSLLSELRGTVAKALPYDLVEML